MISLETLRVMREGTKVSYGPYGNVEFVRETKINKQGDEMQEWHTVMRDKTGNEKWVFSYLFMKYGTVLEQQDAN